MTRGSVVDAVFDAVRRSPPSPAHPWLWAHQRGWRGLALVIAWTLVTAGLTAGAIGELVEYRRVAGVTAAILGVAQVVPLLLSTIRPVAAWLIMSVGLLAGELVLGDQRIWPWPATSTIAFVMVLFQVAAWHERRIGAIVGALTALAVVLPASPIAGMPLWLAAILCGVVAMVLLFGDALGGRRAAEARLLEQTVLRRRDLARQAVLEERGRIARELHDVVAHHMSMIAIQAEAAPHKIPDLPPEARETLVTIREAARAALAETRRVVGLLREEGDAAGRVPQPGLDRLEELVGAAKRAGLSVESRVVGVPRPLADGVDLSAYRIVQEALSNAARHTRNAKVRVELRYGQDQLTVYVRDDGRGAVSDEPGDVPGGGHGLVGMRERVAMLGGTLSTGRRSGGGYELMAGLPYEAS